MEGVAGEDGWAAEVKQRGLQAGSLAAVSHGLQLQSLRTITTAAVSLTRVRPSPRQRCRRVGPSLRTGSPRRARRFRFGQTSPACLSLADYSQGSPRGRDRGGGGEVRREDTCGGRGGGKEAEGRERKRRRGEGRSAVRVAVAVLAAGKQCCSLPLRSLGPAPSRQRGSRHPRFRRTARPLLSGKSAWPNMARV